MSPIILWTLHDWAEAVASLPAHGPLPRRNVLVPNERVAHALRRALVERKRHAALAGTRFLPLLELARKAVIVVDLPREQGIRDKRMHMTLTRALATVRVVAWKDAIAAAPVLRAAG